MYTDDRSAQIVLSLLKQYGIRKVVTSPGMCNVPIAASIQIDPFFEIYSVVDERSAAYFANGLAYETGEPVVISCTGATASRNFLPGLTEAYYQNLPIIALTSQRNEGDNDSLVPQFTNRTSVQKDVCNISVFVPETIDSNEKNHIFFVNKALSFVTKRKGAGPVHINLIPHNVSFNTKSLPNVQKIDFFDSEDLLVNDNVVKIQDDLKNKRVGVFIGSHRKFSSEEQKAIEDFVESFDAIVFCDHTSNYHGKHKVLSTIASTLKNDLLPDVMIDLGGITGDYLYKAIFKGTEVWRVSEDGIFRKRVKMIAKQFDCSEHLFFSSLSKEVPKADKNYSESVKAYLNNFKIPTDLPLSNLLISLEASKKLPKRCSLHLAILHCLRCMDYFYIDESIDCVCNVGGFGIDGPVSTLIGQAANDKNKLCFCHTGDLAFFYDMNALKINNVSKNVRILMINNGLGVEFKLNQQLDPLKSKTEVFIAADNHYGSAKEWAESLGFEYMSASTKEEFLSKFNDFYSENINKFNRPVFFEVFTTTENERLAIDKIRRANYNGSKMKLLAKKVLPKRVIRFLRKMRAR